MFSGHTVVGYGFIPIFVVATPFRRKDLNIFRFFFGFLEALFRCRVVVVAKLKHCRVPSSGNRYVLFFFMKRGMHFISESCEDRQQESAAVVVVVSLERNTFPHTNLPHIGIIRYTAVM